MTFKALVEKILDTANPLVPIILILIGIAFFWGMGKFILSSGSEDERKKGREFMIWAIVALFVAVSVWGLVELVRSTFFDSGDLRAPESDGVDVQSLFN